MKSHLRVLPVLILTVLFIVTNGDDCMESSNVWHDTDRGEKGCPMRFPSCDYTLKPLTDLYGAEVLNVDLASLDRNCAQALKQEAYMYRFLLFRDQDLSWQNQIRFTELIGTPFMETKAVNRKYHPKVPDPRIGYFSNDPDEGLQGQGVEGWHVDGNIVKNPHDFTVIYCVNANRNGPTLIVPLKEIVDMLTNDEKEYLDTISFVSGHNGSVVNPLLYKHPNTNEDTIMLALGILSGLYRQTQENGQTRELTNEETQYIQDILEAKILGSNLIYTHNYRSGDLLLLNNPSVAHIAGPGSQSSVEVSGLRLMHRSTVAGKRAPNKTSSIQYSCASLAPHEDGYCLFSLKGSVYYPRYGIFDSKEMARNRCKRINKHAELATLPTKEWNDIAKDIIRQTGEPHWSNGSNPSGEDVFWGDRKSDFTNWNKEQPNDHNGPEVCVVIGPFAEWFDLRCVPKTEEGTDPGPVITWEDGVRRKYNVYPLCGVPERFK